MGEVASLPPDTESIGHPDACTLEKLEGPEGAIGLLLRREDGEDTSGTVVVEKLPDDPVDKGNPLCKNFTLSCGACGALYRVIASRNLTWATFQTPSGADPRAMCLRAQNNA